MADHLGGDALPDLALGLGVERQGEVGMRLDVDEAGRHDKAARVDDPRSIGAETPADGDDATRRDRDIGLDRGRAAAVDDLAARDEDFVPAHEILMSRIDGT